MIALLTGELLKKKDLAPQEMQAAMEEIMSGSADTGDIAAFLEALGKKRETPQELAAAARVMRKYALKISSKHKIVLDTCGTGGDNSGTFNISTAVAFVTAGAGIPVAKHGNRSVSSKSGSADVLEVLGVNIHMPLETVEKCLNDAGITFLFAQNFHPAMKYAMPARKQIGRRTMFNILGPLSNPAGATHQLVGVYDEYWTDILAKVLADLGIIHALVVHGKDGLDEITTTDETVISEASKAKISTYRISPEDFGLTRVASEELAGGSAQYNAKIILDILEGGPGPKRDIVLLNVAAAIYAADSASTIKAGLQLARLSIDSGKAMKKLEALKEISNS
ncbi:MAG: anthranilate phosphoribosyltransferase [Candidatus Omnitrophota bacterium]|nr:anthranilate phosphoribosyltransferase [Candidatus Omnitrophota bacterium]